MNWFHDFLSDMISNKYGLYNLDFFSEIGFYILVGLCLVSMTFKRLTKKHYVAAIIFGVILELLDTYIDTPFIDVFTNPRLKSLTMELLIYVFVMLVGYVSIVILFFVRKTRTVESIAFTTALVVITTLLYGYHLLILNGGLKTSVESSETFYTKVLGGDDKIFNYFCNSEGVTCYSGRISSFPSHFQELPQDLVDAYKDMAMEKSEPVFILSNVTTTAPVKYTSVFAQRGAQYRLLIETKVADMLFRSQKAQFMVFANAAVLFWFFVSAFVVYVHRKRFFKKRS